MQTLQSHDDYLLKYANWKTEVFQRNIIEQNVSVTVDSFEKVFVIKFVVCDTFESRGEIKRYLDITSSEMYYLPTGLQFICQTGFNRCLNRIKGMNKEERDEL